MLELKTKKSAKLTRTRKKPSSITAILYFLTDLILSPCRPAIAAIAAIAAQFKALWLGDPTKVPQTKLVIPTQPPRGTIIVTPWQPVMGFHLPTDESLRIFLITHPCHHYPRYLMWVQMHFRYLGSKGLKQNCLRKNSENLQCTFHCPPKKVHFYYGLPHQSHPI